MVGQGERVHDEAAAWQGLEWGRRTMPPLRKGEQVPIDLERQNATL